MSFLFMNVVLHISRGLLEAIFVYNMRHARMLMEAVLISYVLGMKNFNYFPYRQLISFRNENKRSDLNLSFSVIF